MKKLFFTLLATVAFGFVADAQVFKLGLKAGPNFSNFSGGIDAIDYSARTSLHIGAAAELGITERFTLAPELLYSSQGADVDNIGDFNLDYISVPVLARIYVLSDKLSVDLGPQFSFLIDDAGKSFENESFDFALAGGLTLNVTKSIFLQGRYTIGLTEASKDAEVKNSVLQLSVGYYFF